MTTLAFPYPDQLGLQPAQSDIMNAICNFHQILLFYLIFICLFVSYMLGQALCNYTNNKKPSQISEAHTLEFIWTIIPSVLLLCIATPSFVLLYMSDNSNYPIPTMNLTVEGHQWYWTYNYINLDNGEEALKIKQIIELLPELILSLFTRNNIKTEELTYLNITQLYSILEECFTILLEMNKPAATTLNSYMIEESSLVNGFRLLECEPLFLPVEQDIQINVTAMDVLHSWAVPALGIKIDAVPGRLNEIHTHLSKYFTISYGQCSELCGINHGFMPIKILNKEMDVNFYTFVSII